MSSQQSVLTKSELAFIRQLNQPSETQRDVSQRLQLVEISEQLSDLLARSSAQEKLTLHAHLANQHLTFDLQIHKDDDNQPSLQLAAPQIYDNGIIQRPWRAKLEKPLPLLKRNLTGTGLYIHQLAMNSALVECRAKRAPKRFQLHLQTEGYPPIAVVGELLRKTQNGLFAYWLRACDPASDENLRQFIYQKHSRRISQPG